jgi:hypothetical protein
VTATAPEHDPLPTADPAPGDPGTGELDALRTWWAELAPARREQLSRLAPAEPLPRGVAADLSHRGLCNPLVLVEESGRLVRRALPSPGLLRFLAAEGGRPGAPR